MLYIDTSAKIPEASNLNCTDYTVNQNNKDCQSTLIFLDSKVKDYQSLLNSTLPNVQAFLISSERDGIEQITEVLSKHHNIDDIHLVSHGSPGCLYLGNSQLSLNTLNNYVEALKFWFSHRGQSRENIPKLYLYGCNVASGDAGEEFLTKLSQITGTTVFASARPTGNVELGGNWELEIKVGQGKILDQNATVALPFAQETLLSYSSVLVIDTLYTDIAKVGNYVYVVYTQYNSETNSTESALEIYDAINPAAPNLVGTYNNLQPDSYLGKLTVVGNNAYIVDQNNSTVQIIDITNHTNPYLKNDPTQLYFDVVPNEVAVVGNILYVPQEIFGIQIIDITQPNNPPVDKLFIDTPNNAKGVTVEGDFLFVADDNSVVKLYKINSSDPSQLTEFPLTIDLNKNVNADKVVVSGNYAFVIYDYEEVVSGVTTIKSEIQVFDISDLFTSEPKDPQLIGTYSFPNYSGDYSTLSNLFYNLTGDVTVVGNYAYINYSIVGYGSDSSETRLEQGIKRINLLNPSEGDSHTQYVSDVDSVIVGEYIYVANGASGLEAIDAKAIINRAPTDITPNQYNLNGNVQANTIVGTLTTIDSDTDDVSFQYSLVSGDGDTNNNLFVIDQNTGQIKTTNSLTAGANYTIRVRTTDAGGLFYEETILIKGSPANSNPTNITLVDNTVDENQGVGTLVGSLATIDPDTGDTFTYSFVSGQGDTDNALFTIEGNQLKTNSTFDYESKQTYSIRVKTTDQGGLVYEKQLTININDLRDLIHQGNYNTSGTAYGVTVGQIAYVADGTEGLQILDISNPTAPTLKGTFNTSGTAWGIVLAGNYAYVADYDKGLQILDISNPNSPTLKSTFDTSGLAYGVTVVGQIAYVADGVSGLQILDISNPNSPTFKGTYNTSGVARGVAVAGNYAYIADGFSGLQVVNISNPNSPSLVATRDTDGYARGLVVVGQFAYLADGSSGLKIYDISNPNSPVLKGSADTPGIAWGVTVDGQFAFVADGFSGLQVFDISNPTAPTFVTSHDTPGNAYEVKVVGQIAYVADSDQGVQVFNISQLHNNHTPSNLDLNNNLIAENQPVGSLIGTLTTTDADAGNTFSYSLVSGTGSTDNTSFTIEGNQLKANSTFDYETKSSYSIRVRTTDQSGLFYEKQLTIGVSNLEGIYRQGTYDTSGNAYGVTVAGQMAYVADGASGLQIIDISNPNSPIPKATYDTSGMAWGVTIKDQIAYVADYSSGLQILDISNPNSPTFKGTYNTSGLAYETKVVGQMAYVADGASGLQIIDISNPVSPILKGTYNTPGLSRGVAVVDNYAYVADGGSGLQILDVSNPNSPIFKGKYDSPSPSNYAMGVAVAGQIAYVASGYAGLDVIDISNPTAPTHIKTYATTNATGVKVVGNYLYVADGGDGLKIFDISNPLSLVSKGGFDTEGNANKVTVVDNHVYVADGSKGLQILNISEMNNPPVQTLPSSGEPIINVAQSAITFGTALSQYRPGASNSDLVRSNFADTIHYIDVSNTATSADDLLKISSLEIKAAGVSIDADFTKGDIILNPGETKRFSLSYTPTAAKENFNLTDGLVIHSNAVNDADLTIALKGKSTFNSDITYDGMVNSDDTNLLNAKLGSILGSANYDPTADITGDGIINSVDLSVLTGFGQSLV